jgi:hypothetical protein
MSTAATTSWDFESICDACPFRDSSNPIVGTGFDQIRCACSSVCPVWPANTDSSKKICAGERSSFRIAAPPWGRPLSHGGPGCSSQGARPWSERDGDKSHRVSGLDAKGQTCQDASEGARNRVGFFFSGAVGGSKLRMAAGLPPSRSCSDYLVVTRTLRSFSPVVSSAISRSRSLTKRENFSPHSTSKRFFSPIRSSRPRVSSWRAVSTRYRSM